MYKLFQTITNAIADTNSEWIYLKPSNGKSDKLIIQGYYDGADDVDGTVTLYGTLNTTLASTKGMEKIVGALTTLTTTGIGAYTWEVDNYGYTALQVKYVINSVTTLPTMLIYINWKY